MIMAATPAPSASILRWETFFDEMESFIRSSQRQQRGASIEYAQFVSEKYESIIRNLICIVEVFNHNQPNESDEDGLQTWTTYRSTLRQLVDCCRSSAAEWGAYIDSMQSNPYPDSYLPPLLRQEHVRGRPSFEISRDQLIYLSSLSFTWTEIAKLLGVSRMTIYRRRCEFDLLVPNRNELSDVQLKDLICNWKSEMPAVGETLVMGRLHANGYCVTRERVRCALRAVDPLNTSLRSPHGLSRRQMYSVPSPNSLWHIDGHHKLVRWRLVTHAGIDGYSRMIVFMVCSDNNRATTMYEAFLEGVQSFSLPSRVRCDQGGENSLVAAHMLEHRGSERRSVIIGSSVHNQRIERLWRDMHRCVTQLFYRLFYYLEYHNLLDPLNEAHLAAVNYIFKPRINQALKHFKDGWNSHAVRTAHNRSPYQLFVSGALQLHRSGLVALDFLDSVDDSYGVAEEGLATDDNAVEIPENTFTLRDDHFQELERSIDPLCNSSNYGIDLYLQTLDFFRLLIMQNPGLYT